MSVILFALIAGICALAVMVIVRNMVRPPAVNLEHPTCGRCGYIVRGIESLTCPECGGDLREVGIIPPGGRQRGRLSNGARLTIWTVIVLPPVLLLAFVITRALGSMWAISQQNRVIFVQSPTLNTTVRATLDGRQLVRGQSAFVTQVPYQTLTLNLQTGKPTDQLKVDLATHSGRFTDARGKNLGGRFDAGLIATWLMANGFGSSPDLDPRSHDVLAAVTEMTSNSPRAGGFSRFAPDPRLGNPMVTAHPAFATRRIENTSGTNIIPYIAAGVVWLIGPILIFRRRHGAGVGESRAAAAMSA